MLDVAVPLLTGDPTSTMNSILNMREDAAMLETLTEEELHRQRTRALLMAVTVVNFEIARNPSKYIPHQITEFTALLAAATRAFNAVLAAFDPKQRPAG
jgi:hypothetical protein